MQFDFKKSVIQTAIDSFDRIYIHSAPSDNLFIGKRGLLGSEKENGIMLSFSGLSCKNMVIDDEGIKAELRFAGIWEPIFIPYESIDAVLDDVQSPSFIFNFINDEEITKNIPNIHKKEKIKNSAEILKPDFTKKRKQ